MKIFLPVLMLTVETSVVLGSPYERNGIIYDGRLEQPRARHEVRDLAVEASVLDVVASMLTNLRHTLHVY